MGRERIGEAWESFERQVIPPDAGDVQREEDDLHATHHR